MEKEGPAMKNAAKKILVVAAGPRPRGNRASLAS